LNSIRQIPIVRRQSPRPVKRTARNSTPHLDENTDVALLRMEHVQLSPSETRDGPESGFAIGTFSILYNHPGNGGFNSFPPSQSE
jgi:hypothetical protein